MLTNHPKLQPALVRCHAEALQRLQVTADGVRALPSRFESVLDERGAELGAVTRRFKLVQTADVVAAFDLEADRLGYALDPHAAFYRNGLAKVELDIPARRFAVDDRDGGITPRVILVHGLGGRGGLRVWAGGEIAVCTNGAVFGKVLDVSYARHTRSLDIRAIVRKAMGKLDEAIQRTEVVVAAARATRVAPEVFHAIRESAPERHRRTFESVANQNVRTYGSTAWAAIQAVTELATHHMRERRDGSHVWAADDWSQRQVAALTREHALVPAGR